MGNNNIGIKFMQCSTAHYKTALKSYAVISTLSLRIRLWYTFLFSSLFSLISPANVPWTRIASMSTTMVNSSLNITYIRQGTAINCHCMYTVSGSMNTIYIHLEKHNDKNSIECQLIIILSSASALHLLLMTYPHSKVLTRRLLSSTKRSPCPGTVMWPTRAAVPRHFTVPVSVTQHPSRQLNYNDTIQNHILHRFSACLHIHACFVLFVLTTDVIFTSV